MNEVKAKKFLGQHFLTDESIAQRIVDSLSGRSNNVIEIGPGMGVLTKYLIGKQELNFHVVEIDRESVAWLHEHYPSLDVIEGDFLKLDLNALFHDTFAVIGNFPYNISSQILFRVFECRNQAVEVVGMFQKEVAERVAAGPGSKTYGILSVLLSAFYDIEYLFTVHEHVFNPPPKVKSAVIRLTRNSVTSLECDEKLFVQVVKAGFNQRRKTLRNALRSANLPIDAVDEATLGKRAEQLSVGEFVALTKSIEDASVCIKTASANCLAEASFSVTPRGCRKSELDTDGMESTPASCLEEASLSITPHGSVGKSNGLATSVSKRRTLKKNNLHSHNP